MESFFRKFAVSVLAFFAICICTISYAAVERITEYEYDDAGNVVRILTFEQSNPPTISPLDPNFLNLGRTITVTATGTNLLGVDVITDVTDLTINAVNSTNDQVTFELTSTNLTPLGPATIRFVTGLGEVQETISVVEAGPDLATNPSPIAIDDAGTVTNVQLTFSEPRPENEIYSITTDDAATASTVSNSFSISTGETQVTISLTGVSAGTTQLRVDLPAKFYTYTFAVYVGDTYDELTDTFPDMLQQNLFTNAVGVTVQENNPYLPNTVTSGEVGVLVDSNGSVFSSPVGIFYGDGQVGQLLSLPVGVLISDAVSYAYSSPVGAIYGPLILESHPPTVTVGNTVDFEISGFNLDEVQTITIVPSDDLTIGTFTLNPENTVLTVPITIDPAAALGSREIILEDSVGPVPINSGQPITFEIQ